jgi:hypothetical protein
LVEKGIQPGRYRSVSLAMRAGVGGSRIPNLDRCRQIALLRAKSLRPSSRLRTSAELAPCRSAASISVATSRRSRLSQSTLPACRSSAAFGCTLPPLEYLQHFPPGRHPAIEDFAVGTRSAVRRDCYRPPMAALVRLAAFTANIGERPFRSGPDSARAADRQASPTRGELARQGCANSRASTTRQKGRVSP